MVSIVVKLTMQCCSLVDLSALWFLLTSKWFARAEMKEFVEAQRVGVWYFLQLGCECFLGGFCMDEWLSYTTIAWCCMFGLMTWKWHRHVRQGLWGMEVSGKLPWKSSGYLLPAGLLFPLLIGSKPSPVIPSLKSNMGERITGRTEEYLTGVNWSVADEYGRMTTCDGCRIRRGYSNQESYIIVQSCVTWLTAHTLSLISPNWGPAEKTTTSGQSAAGLGILSTPLKSSNPNRWYCNSKNDWHTLFGKVMKIQPLKILNTLS